MITLEKHLLNKIIKKIKICWHDYFVWIAEIKIIINTHILINKIIFKWNSKIDRKMDRKIDRKIDKNIDKNVDRKIDRKIFR